MTGKDLTNEVWREYDIPGRLVPYHIDSPEQLFVGMTTHKVVDSEGIVHCVPFPGKGTVLRWKPRDLNNPVAF